MPLVLLSRRLRSTAPGRARTGLRPWGPTRHGAPGNESSATYLLRSYRRHQGTGRLLLVQILGRVNGERFWSGYIRQAYLNRVSVTRH